jgi:hypothetical protein
MPGFGNDPFSGSSTQNVLQHVISPKVIPDGSGGYVVKTDLINVDHLHITGDIYRNGQSINQYISVLPTTVDTNSPPIFRGASVSIGESSYDTVHGAFTTSIGSGAGQSSQEQGAVAIGASAGRLQQSTFAVAVGNGAGATLQKTNAVAVGKGAGNAYQGENSIAIGCSAGSTSQAANSIVINAIGTSLQNTTSNSCIIKPIRQVAIGDLPAGSVHLYWNPTTGELMAVTT